MNKPSTRFNRTVLTEKVVPVVLGLLFLGLVAVMVIVGLNSAGVFGA